MKIEKRYLKKYYYDAVIDQLKADYKKRGYTVATKERLANTDFQADLVARKEDSMIILEIKTGIINTIAKQQIKKMSEVIKDIYPNAKFRLVAVNYPDENDINIENIEEIILDFFLSNGMPSELDELSSHTTIDEVTDVLINSIDITSGIINMICEAHIVVVLDYGDKEEDTPFRMSFPFQMKASLSMEGDKIVVRDIDELIIDTSEFYK